MKKIIILLILLGTKNLSAQTNNDKLILEKCKKPLIEVYKTHSILFDKIENYLVENSKIEQPKFNNVRDYKIDSINRIHNLNLCAFYLYLFQIIFIILRVEYNYTKNAKPLKNLWDFLIS